MVTWQALVNFKMMHKDACAEAELPRGPFDLLMGSDIVWGGDPENHTALCRTVPFFKFESVRETCKNNYE